MNAYLLFLDEKKSEFIREAGGDYKKGISLASKAWKALPADNQYVQRAKQLKDKYDEDLESFLRASGDTTKVKENGLKIELMNGTHEIERAKMESRKGL